MLRSIVIVAGLIAVMASCNPPGQQGSEPAKGPELLWKYEGLGKGYGAPLITKEGIFINAEEEGNSYSTTSLKTSGMATSTAIRSCIKMAREASNCIFPAY